MSMLFLGISAINLQRRMAPNSLGDRRLHQPPWERGVHLPFVSGNALIYEIHMATLPRPQPCKSHRRAGGGGWSQAAAPRPSMLHSLRPAGAHQRGGDPGIPCGAPHPVQLLLQPCPNHLGKLPGTGQRFTISHEMTHPDGPACGAVPQQPR